MRPPRLDIDQPADETVRDDPGADRTLPDGNAPGGAHGGAAGGVRGSGPTGGGAKSIAISLGVAGAAMVLLRAPHPPGGATALIVSLGLLPHLDQ